MLLVNNTPFKVAIKVTVFLSVILAIFQMPFLFPKANLSQQHILMALVIISFTSLLTYLMLKQEKSSLNSLGLNWQKNILLHLAIGILSGLVVIFTIIGSLLLTTNLDFEATNRTSFFTYISMSISTILILALMEEVIFRGYILFKLKQVFGIRIAIYATAVTFGLYHGLSIDSLMGPAIWGLLYGWMAIKSQGIALPTAFHFALNWGQSVFNMKEKYVVGPYEFVLSEHVSPEHVDTAGLIIQLIVATVSIILIERLARQEG